MAKENCCPAPGDLRAYRLDSTSGDVLSLVVTVPAGRVLIINAWVSQTLGAGGFIRLLRDTTVVASRRGGGSSFEFPFDMLFPTGIAFFAGESLTIDHGTNAAVSGVYGYEQDE